MLAPLLSVTVTRRLPSRRCACATLVVSTHNIATSATWIDLRMNLVLLEGFAMPGGPTTPQNRTGRSEPEQNGDTKVAGQGPGHKTCVLFVAQECVKGVTNCVFSYLDVKIAFVNQKFGKPKSQAVRGGAKAYTVSAITLHGFVERIFRIENETCPHFFSYLTKTLRQLLRLPY